MNRVLLVFALLAVLLVPAAAQNDPLRIVTYDSFSISEDVLDAFVAEAGFEVEIVRLSDAGATVNQAVLTRENPLGDVLYGIDNTFLSRGLKAGIFEPYESPLLETIPDDFKLDPDFRVTPVAYGDVCLNYDVAWFAEHELAVPETLAALTQPEYASLLVVENPAVSSPGLAFLMATIAAFPDDSDYTWQDYWADLVANDVLVVGGWTEAYYGEFSGSLGEGSRPLVVSYASSPPVEMYFADPLPETQPTAPIIADGMCFRQVEFAGILSGTQKRAQAEQFIDFLLDVEFQGDLPLQMFVFPVNPDAELPDIFVAYAAVPENPVLLPAEDIETNREEWIQTWTEIVLR